MAKQQPWWEKSDFTINKLAVSSHSHLAIPLMDMLL
jgi:hypothetical protein